MISEKMKVALNHQINAELESAYAYLAISSYAAHIGLKGVANWFSIQTQEELVHAKKIYDYVQSQGEHVVLTSLTAPAAEYESALQMFEFSLDHERKITGQINDLILLAQQEKDKATEVVLQWFISEQVEEEDQARQNIDMLKLAGEKGEGLFLVDKELAKRQLTTGANSA